MLIDKTEQIFTYGVLTDIDDWYFMKLGNGKKVEFFKGHMFVGVSALAGEVRVDSGARSTIYFLAEILSCFRLSSQNFDAINTTMIQQSKFILRDKLTRHSEIIDGEEQRRGYEQIHELKRQLEEYKVPIEDIQRGYQQHRNGEESEHKRKFSSAEARET